MHRCPKCSTVTQAWAWKGGPSEVGSYEVCPKCGWRGWDMAKLEREVPKWKGKTLEVTK